MNPDELHFTSYRPKPVTYTRGKVKLCHTHNMNRSEKGKNVYYDVKIEGSCLYRNGEVCENSDGYAFRLDAYQEPLFTCKTVALVLMCIEAYFKANGEL